MLHFWTMWAAAFAAFTFGLSYVACTAVQCEPSKRPYAVEHDEFCDKFYICENGKATEELCDDGLLYDIEKERCEMPHIVVCGDRKKQQNATSNIFCPRLNGMFPVPSTCDQFYHCTAGRHTLITCPPGVVFEPSVGACIHADQSSRINCSASRVLDFACPNNDSLFKPLRFGDHDRLAHPTSCRHFFMCLTTGMPRLGGCSIGLVFNSLSGRCDEPKNVKGCENWYDADNINEEDEDIQTSTKASPSSTPLKMISNSTAIRSPLSSSIATTNKTQSGSISSSESSVEIVRSNSSPLVRKMLMGNNRLLSRTTLESDGAIVTDDLGASKRVNM